MIQIFHVNPFGSMNMNSVVQREFLQPLNMYTDTDTDNSDFEEEDENSYDSMEDSQESTNSYAQYNPDASKLQRLLHFHHVQQQLDCKLVHRPNLDDLWKNHILHTEASHHIAPSLQAIVRSLEFQRRLSDVDYKFGQRPEQSRLVQNHIMKINPAVSPRIQATQQSLIFRQRQDGLSQKLEKRPKFYALMNSNIIPRHNLDLAAGLLPVMQVLSFKMSKRQMEAKMGSHRSP